MFDNGYLSLLLRWNKSHKKVYYGNNRDKTASEPVGSHPALWFESGQAKPRTSGYVHY